MGVTIGTPDHWHQRISIDALRAASRDELVNVHEIGDRVAESILQFFQRVENRTLIERLADVAAALGMGGAAFAFFGVLFVFVPALRWRGWVQRTAALFALVPVLAYAALAGLPVSTQRAAVMLIVLMAAILIQRQSDPFNTLALAALVVLAVHPPALFSISFQLSFCTVSAILYGLTCSGDWWRRGRWGYLFRQ